LSACFIRPASSVIRSSFIRSLLSYPRRGQFLVTPRGAFSMARDKIAIGCAETPFNFDTKRTTGGVKPQAQPHTRAR
jgi:hypothetical protein